MTKSKTVAYTAVALLTLQLGAATKEPDVATGDCETQIEELKGCIATGEPCLDQVLVVVECLDGNGLVEVNAQRVGLVVATKSGTPEWRVTLARPEGPGGGDSANTAYYRTGKCHANPRGDKAAAGTLVVIENADDPQLDRRYHGFANRHCDGRVAVGTVADTKYFSSAVLSYVDTGVPRPDITSLAVSMGN